MKQETINKILALADKAFVSNESPDKYARTAAHEAACAAAEKHSTECANAAALIAANEFSAVLSDAAAFSSRVTDASNDQVSYERRYHATRESYENALIIPQNLTERPFVSVLRPSNAMAHMTSSALHSSYLSMFCRENEANHRAKHAARYVYRHTYCTARSAYVVSYAEAQKEQNPANRERVFKSLISKRLNQDLKYDQLEPGLFIEVMSSLSVQIIAGILLVAGVLGVVCGALGVAALPLMETISIGALVSLFAVSLFIGGHFASEEVARIEACNERCDELNNIS